MGTSFQGPYIQTLHDQQGGARVGQAWARGGQLSPVGWEDKASAHSHPPLAHLW